MKHLVAWAHSVAFWFFIAVKVAGSSFATWSWLWILIPEIPIAGLFVQRWGL